MSSQNNNNNIATTIVPTTPTQDVQVNAPNNNVNDNNKYRWWTVDFDIAFWRKWATAVPIFPQPSALRLSLRL
jgi:hypothetical protein